jgi:hypothetical protein
MFNRAGSGFESAKVVGCGKSRLYHGLPPVCNSYTDLSATRGGTTVLLDTVNPVVTPFNADNGPQAEFFVSSFNINGDVFGHDCSTTACSGAAIFAWSDPANTTGGGNKLTGILAPTSHSYI